MTNPAAELVGLFEAWRLPKSVAPHTARARAAEKRGTTFVDDVTRAMKLFIEIDRALDDMERRGVPTGAFRETVPSWQRAFLSFNFPWQSTVNQDTMCIGVEHLRLLEALASHIDLLRSVESLPPDRLAYALARVKIAEDFVQDSADVTEPMRLQLLGLLLAIREALELGDTAEAGARIAEFVGRSTIVGEVVEQANPGRGDAWRQMGRDFAANFVSGGALLLLQAATAGAM